MFLKPNFTYPFPKAGVTTTRPLLEAVVTGYLAEIGWKRSEDLVALDAEVPFEEVTLGLLDELDRLEPRAPQRAADADRLKAAIGEPCIDARCVEGAYCEGPTCVARQPSGAACEPPQGHAVSRECIEGTVCSDNGDGTGTCRPLPALPFPRSPARFSVPAASGPAPPPPPPG